jgi:hypothetical protein
MIALRAVRPKQCGFADTEKGLMFAAPRADASRTAW